MYTGLLVFFIVALSFPKYFHMCVFCLMVELYTTECTVSLFPPVLLKEGPMLLGHLL